MQFLGRKEYEEICIDRSGRPTHRRWVYFLKGVECATWEILTPLGFWRPLQPDESDPRNDIEKLEPAYKALKPLNVREKCPEYFERQEGKILTFMDYPVTELSREDLIAIIGFCYDQADRIHKQVQYDRAFMSSLNGAR